MVYNAGGDRAAFAKVSKWASQQQTKQPSLTLYIVRYLIRYNDNGIAS